MNEAEEFATKVFELAASAGQNVFLATMFDERHRLAGDDVKLLELLSSTLEAFRAIEDLAYDFLHPRGG
jgi:hypothetical protein